MLAIIAAGLLSGAHAATWGGYKDSPFEGFHLSRQARSVAVAGLAAFVVAITGWLRTEEITVVIGAVYAIERLATEWWKTILRDDDQSAYSIPMRLGYRGRPVDRPGLRYGVGAGVLVIVVLSFAALHLVQGALPQAPVWLVTIGIGGIGGWATAVGGAWKDAPVEGFSGWKFLRSPVVATAWAVPLSTLTSDWPTLVLAAGGLAVATIETYKTFLTGDRPPGKFAHKPQQFPVGRVRLVLGMAHAGLWACLALWSALTLDHLSGGPAGGDVLAGSAPAGWLGAMCIAAVAAVLSVLVIRTNGRLAHRVGTLVQGAGPDSLVNV